MRTMGPSVIVDDNDVLWTIRRPDKTDPKLPVDPNTVLAPPITLERFQLVGWWYPERFPRYRSVQVIELPPGDGPERIGTHAPRRARIDAIVDILSATIGE